MPGFFRSKRRKRSVSSEDWTAEAIVDADAQDIVGEMRGVRCRRRGTDRHQNSGKRNRACTDGAEVHIEILELCSPVSADPAFDAGTRRPARPYRRSTRESDRDRNALRIVSGDAAARLDVAVSQTAGSIQEHGRSDENSGAASDGAEPVQLLGQGQI